MDIYTFLIDIYDMLAWLLFFIRLFQDNSIIRVIHVKSCLEELVGGIHGYLSPETKIILMPVVFVSSSLCKSFLTLVQPQFKSSDSHRDAPRRPLSDIPELI